MDQKCKFLFGCIGNAKNTPLWFAFPLSTPIFTFCRVWLAAFYSRIQLVLVFISCRSYIFSLHCCCTIWTVSNHEKNMAYELIKSKLRIAFYLKDIFPRRIMNNVSRTAIWISELGCRLTTMQKQGLRICKGYQWGASFSLRDSDFCFDTFPIQLNGDGTLLIWMPCGMLFFEVSLPN